MFNSRWGRKRRDLFGAGNHRVFTRLRLSEEFGLGRRAFCYSQEETRSHDAFIT